MWAGVEKSGSPVARLMTSTPDALRRRARSATATVADGSLADRRADNDLNGCPPSLGDRSGTRAPETDPFEDRVKLGDGPLVDGTTGSADVRRRDRAAPRVDVLAEREVQAILVLEPYEGQVAGEDRRR